MIEDPATLVARDVPRPAEAVDDVADEGLPRATGAALYGFCLVFGIGLLPGPFATLLIWRLRRDEPFVDWHGRQALDLALTALAAGVLFFVGRMLEPVNLVVASLAQWVALIALTIQAVQGVWGFVDAARGGRKELLLSLRLLRRGGTWAAQASAAPEAEDANGVAASTQQGEPAQAGDAEEDRSP